MVKIYRRSSRQSFSKGKPSYKYYRLYLPIPAKFKPVVEPFLAKDLAVEVKAVEHGQLLLIMAQEQLPIELLAQDRGLSSPTPGTRRR